MRTRLRDVQRDETSSGGGSGQPSPGTAEGRRWSGVGDVARVALIIAVIAIILCNSGWNASPSMSDPESLHVTKLKSRRRNKEHDDLLKAALRASSNTGGADGASHAAWEKAAVPLPDATEGFELKRRLEASCRDQPIQGMDRLPSKLHVRGLPAGGYRRVSKFLYANLRNVDVTSPVGGIGMWANLPPFHPDAEKTIVDNCRNRKGGTWYATVYVIRSPLPWMSSLTNEDFEQKQCMDAGRKECFYPSCSSPINGCVETSTPRGWRFPNPLDLWAAYATHLPPSTPVSLVVHYETFLTNPSAVLQAVTSHFGLRMPPPPKSGGDFKVNKHRQIWLNFKRLIALVGEKEGEGAAAMLRRKDSDQNDRIKCATATAVKELFGTSQLAALQSAENRNVLHEALSETGYEVLHSSAAKAMLKSCSISPASAPARPTGTVGRSSLETCTKWDWQVLAGNHSGIDAIKTKRMNELQQLAQPIPDPASRAETTRALEAACLAKREALGPGPRAPPKEIHVRGLPNTGTNAYQALLGATFNVTIFTGEKTTGKLWKHMLPSHPDLHAMITDTYCPRDDVATVFVVRHPVAWMLSQMSPGHNYGSFCDDRDDATGDACFFSACHVQMKQWCNAGFSRLRTRCVSSGRTWPRYWRFPTLLDLWAAWVSYIPETPVTMLVRYEDLFSDPEKVLKAVAGKFNLPFHHQPAAKGSDGSSSSIPINVLEGYARPFEKGYKHSSAGIQDSKRRWESFLRFWRQEFSSSSNDGPHPDLRGGGNASSGTFCAYSDPTHHLLDPSQLRSLRSAEERGVLNSAAPALGYEVPRSDKAQRAWDVCGRFLPQQPVPYSSTSQKPNQGHRRRPSRLRAFRSSALRPPSQGLQRQMQPQAQTLRRAMSRRIIRPHQERV